MASNWRVLLFPSITMLLVVSGIFTRTAEAQINGLDLKGDAGFDSVSQAPPGAQRGTFLSWYEWRNRGLGDQVNPEGSLDLDVPRFDQNSGGGFEDSFCQLVNLGEGIDQEDDSSTQVLAPPPIARAQSQINPELLVDANSPGAPDAAPALPKSSDPSDPGWHVSVSPYIWFAGLHGTVGALGHEASVHASFGDIFSYLNFGLMVAAEPRYNRIVMPFDFMWMKLSDDKALPIGAGATSVKVKINQDMLAQKIGYRIIDSEKFKVDALAGFRYWHLGTTLTVQSPLGSSEFYQASNWVDGLGGAKIQAILSPKLVLTITGDAGGGGANLDYQMAGLIGLKLKKVILQAGWRYLSVNYRPSGGFVNDMTTSGLIMGVTIPLK